MKKIDEKMKKRACREKGGVKSLFLHFWLYNLRKLMIFDMFSQLIGVFSEKYRIFAPSLKES